MNEKTQQEIFVKYGFRPVINNMDLKSVPDSPWSENIPDAKVISNPVASELMLPAVRTRRRAPCPYN